MSVGAKIKYIRNLRGLTQKEVGRRAGFSETTADVRIRQYESNRMKPKAALLKDIAKALDVKPQAISNPDLTTHVGVMFALFELEERYGLHIESINNHYYLDFAKQEDTYPYDIMSNYIKSWYEEKNKRVPQIDDTPETREQKKKAYELWKCRFPSDKVEHDAETSELYGIKHRLEKEIEEINAKLNGNQ